MPKTIYCQKLKTEAESLDFAPYPGALGEKILETISKEAWAQWLQHQTTLINEHRLNMLDPNARSFLKAEMEKFLWGEGSEKPSGFKPL